MVTTQLIRRQVETYQDAWKQDYHAAQECHDCEEFVRLGLFIFSELKKVNLIWRERVFPAVYPRADSTVLALGSGGSLP